GCDGRDDEREPAAHPQRAHSRSPGARHGPLVHTGATIRNTAEDLMTRAPGRRARAYAAALVVAAAETSERSSTSPSSEPSSGELARSGWGMRPTTLP